MTALTKSVRGYHPQLTYPANGALALVPLSGAGAGVFDPAAIIDGLREAFTNLRIDELKYTQLVDGGGGSTVLEVFRRRAAANTLLGTITLAQGGGAFASASVVPASEALREFQVGDLVFYQFTAVQTGSPADGVLEIPFT